MGSARSHKDFAIDYRAIPFDSCVAEKLVGHTVAEIERALILQTLNDLDWNRTRAATVLGISIRSLRQKIHQFKDEGLIVPTALSRMDQ
jgi:DNA-binding NtrC family response regulator